MSSVIGALVTAPDADDTVFPLNTPVLIFGRDSEKISKLGTRGTAWWVLDGLNEQEVAPLVVIVRVERYPKPITSVLMSVTNKLTEIKGELMNRTPGADIDVLKNADVNMITLIYSGNDYYEKGTDYIREGDAIKWLTYDTVETIQRRTSSVDPLVNKTKARAILEVSQGVKQFRVGIDCQLHSEGIEWLTTNRPTPHTEYKISYTYGRQPAPNEDYEVDYFHFSYEHVENEIVNRDPSERFDYLEQRDIIRILSISRGNDVYSEGDDFQLSDDQILWLENSEIEIVTRGSETTDSLAQTDVLELVEISQGLDIFTKNVDWEQSNGGIKWLTENQPDTGTSYNVTLTYGKRPPDNADYEITYDYKSGEIVAMDRVIGGISPEGISEGCHALYGAHGELGVTPKLLIAPGFTHHSSVVHEMENVAAENLATIIVDGPNKTNEAAIQYRQEFGTERVYLVDPWVKFRNPQLGIYDAQPPSARVAALINRIDNQLGPWWSPSNKAIKGFDGTTRDVSKTYGVNSVSDYLNMHHVATITRGAGGGYLLWGNRNCSNDPQNWFLSVSRMDDIIQESIQEALAIQLTVDYPFGVPFLETLLESIASFLRGLAAANAIILGEQNPVWVDPYKNTPASIKAGKFFGEFDFDFRYPMENITLTRHINPAYLENELKNNPYLRK